MHAQRIPRTAEDAARHTFGAAARELRFCRGLSQEQLAYRTKLHRNYVGALERGEINPTFRTMRTLAAGLDVELSSLIRLYEERHEDAQHDLRVARDIVEPRSAVASAGAEASAVTLQDAAPAASSLVLGR